MNRAERRRLAKDQAKRRAAVLVGGSESLQQQLQPGLAHHQAGRLDQAQAYYQSMLAEQPDHAEANHLLGVAFGMQGRLGEAIVCLQKAVALKPGFAEAYHNLEHAYSRSGAIGEAVAALRNATRFDPENGVYWENLAETISNVSFSEIDDKLLEDLLLMLERPVVRSDKLSSAINSALRHHPDITGLLAHPGSQAEEYHAVAGRMSQIPLLLRIMALNVFDAMDFEDLLSGLRRGLIRADAAQEAAPRSLPFSAALALQCFTTEYAYRETAEESAAVEALEQQVKDGGAITPHGLCALAAYRALHDLPGAEELIERAWPEPVMALIERQLREPLAERSLALRIPSVTPIDDKVSKGVRDQYEENPYPRWVKAGLASQPLSIGQYLRATVFNPHVGDYVSPSKPDVLIAGCGTGQQALGAASRYDNASVLAVDLSLASLSYALRKTEELGIGTIEYCQGDILELKSHGRPFDLIECVGGLHHMRDPLAGWRVLVDVLRPGGLMFVALYSEAARQPVVMLREMIAEKDYAASVDNIRRFRGDIMDAARNGDTEMAKIVEWRDFYGMSCCRDLLFHVQEHRFTIPKIEDALDQLGLEFLGFDMSGNRPAMLEFQAIHDDTAFASLAAWHEFECENPATFHAMYQFWVQKPGG